MTTAAELISAPPALIVDDLKVVYDTPEGEVKAVNGVSFTLRAGERLALVGESGCGKTTLALTLMRLLKPPARIDEGRVVLGDRDLLQLSEDEMRAVRLDEIALVPQGAMNSLNPVMRVEEQIIDGMIDHGLDGTRPELRQRAIDQLRSVGLSPAVARMYPHELSGGMKQRVAMAIATVLRPKVIIADEPTSALDVVVQRQVMTMLIKLQMELGASVVLVGHDMGLVAQVAERVGVMYAGRLVEIGPVEQIFSDPLHPYTRLLIQSLPTLEEKKELVGIPGLPPSLVEPPSGCVFNPRCPAAMADLCTTVVPILAEVRTGQTVACHLYPECTP